MKKCYFLQFCSNRIRDQSFCSAGVYTSSQFVHRFCVKDSVLRARKRSERASCKQLGSRGRSKAPCGCEGGRSHRNMYFSTFKYLQIAFPRSSSMSFQWTHLVTKKELKIHLNEFLKLLSHSLSHESLHSNQIIVSRSDIVIIMNY